MHAIIEIMAQICRIYVVLFDNIIKISGFVKASENQTESIIGNYSLCILVTFNEEILCIDTYKSRSHC